ncbi:thioredoxin domain-containing protein [Salinibacterium sp. ZJ70]|uniref:DsbA family protein n=1 Tax=Salinibacterium sp. ZJ70 TaxID=2708084 RepID=UPI001423487F|nr:thioredoxin domain-containing protein [Salinibacterium sp. ZJ70]
MTNTPRPTRNEQRERAREAARIAREKEQKRKSLLKWLVPTVASVAILAIVAGVIWAVIAFQPPPKAEAGPANMLSDGFVLEAQDGELAFVETEGIAKGESPVPTTPQEGLLNIVTYLDYKCPHCKTFEDTYGPTIDSLVKEGVATLEIRPVAIMGPPAVRAANVAACAAEYAPEKFADVNRGLFANQGVSSTSGYIDILREAGVESEDADACVRGDSFSPWVEAATARSGVRGTPTIIINGTQWDAQAQPDFTAFLTDELSKLSAGS